MKGEGQEVKEGWGLGGLRDKGREGKITHLVSCTSTADPQSHSCSTAHMRVVALRQQRHHTRALLWSPVHTYIHTERYF